LSFIQHFHAHKTFSFSDTNNPHCAPCHSSSCLPTISIICSSLPNIPTEAEVKTDGINIAEMNVKLLQKVEELTLYVIGQQKQIDELKKANK